MDNNEFKSKALRTEPNDEAYVKVTKRLHHPPVAGLLIAKLQALALTLNELDEMKKYLFYGKEAPLLTKDCNALEKGTFTLPNYNEKVEQGQSIVDSITSVRLLHGIMGIATESGELIEALLKMTSNFCQTVDRINIMEEIGDIAWYQAIISDELKFSVDDANEKVIKKLMKRFPDKFDEGNAINRDLDTERKTLEE